MAALAAERMVEVETVVKITVAEGMAKHFLRIEIGEVVDAFKSDIKGKSKIKVEDIKLRCHSPIYRSEPFRRRRSPSPELWEHDKYRGPLPKGQRSKCTSTYFMIMISYLYVTIFYCKSIDWNNVDYFF